MVTRPSAHPTNKVGPTGGVMRPMPRVDEQDHPEVDGIDPDLDQDREQDGRADEDHGGHVEEGAEPQQQTVDEKKEHVLVGR